MAESSPLPRARAPRSPQPRRTHAERTAETRARVIAAVVESIAEVGLTRTSASEITSRAGVTWGAVQHHFGSKDALLVAVLDDSFERFAERLADVPLEGVPLAERVDLFLDRAWQHFHSQHYRSTFEILLHHLARHDLPEAPAWRERMLTAWDRVWQSLFADTRLPRRRRTELQHYTVSVLSGLASTLVLEGPEARLRPRELGLLAETLVRELTRPAEARKR